MAATRARVLLCSHRCQQPRRRTMRAGLAAAAAQPRRRPRARAPANPATRRLLRRRLPEVRAICAAHHVHLDFDEILQQRTIREFERCASPL
jgi:hypothetical protein